MKKNFLNYLGLIISILYAIILPFCHTDNGKDSIFIFFCFSVFLISIPFQIILSVAYGVFAFREKNRYTPIVPGIIVLSLYNYLNHYFKDFSEMSPKFLLLIVGILMLLVTLFVLIRVKISFWIRKNKDKILKLTNAENTSSDIVFLIKIYISARRFRKLK